MGSNLASNGVRAFRAGLFLGMALLFAAGPSFVRSAVEGSGQNRQQRSSVSVSSSQSAAPTVASTVSLPTTSVATNVTSFSLLISATDTTGNNYIGFQGDFTFNETIATVVSASAAGITASGWTVQGNLLAGAGPTRTFRFIGTTNDGVTPLAGAGTLFRLNLTKAAGGTSGSSTPLTWVVGAQGFKFLDGNTFNLVDPAAQTNGTLTVLARTSTIAAYLPSDQTFYLRNSNSAGFADLTILYGPSGATPIVGDWDGDGTVTIGVYDPSAQTFYLRNSNTGGFADITIQYGPPGAIPLAGDWNGDGTTTIGVYDPAGRTFYLRNSNSVGLADLTILYGPSAAVPVVGDWDGNGTTTIGVYDPSGQTFYLRNSNSAGFADLTIGYGPSGVTPVVGDWDGTGTVTIGVYDPANQTFYLRNSNTLGFADLTISYGPGGANPLAGDWNGV